MDGGSGYFSRRRISTTLSQRAFWQVAGIATVVVAVLLIVLATIVG
jgi:anti-sigma-K factor RskA